MAALILAGCRIVEDPRITQKKRQKYQLYSVHSTRGEKGLRGFIEGYPDVVDLEIALLKEKGKPGQVRIVGTAREKLTVALRGFMVPNQKSELHTHPRVLFPDEP